MDIINITETKATPSIILDPENQLFELKGCSRPENVREFYMPVINWFENTIANIENIKQKYQDTPMVFEIKLSYFNSASAKFILDILLYINQIHEKGLKTKINWYYEDGDEDMRDVGEELAEMVDFDFKYIIMKE